MNAYSIVLKLSEAFLTWCGDHQLMTFKFLMFGAQGSLHLIYDFKINEEEIA